MRKSALPLACSLLLAGPFCFAAVADTDVGWHVAIGRLVLRGTLQRTNAFSWVAATHPWYPTSWLYDAALAATLDVFPQALGAQLLTFALLAVAALALCVACRREGTAWAAPAALVLLVPRLVPRPQVASFALLAAVLALAPRSTRARALCVALVAVGGNLHAGAAFGAGVLGLEALEAFWRTRQRAELLIAGCAALALLANPGLLFNARYLLEHLLTVNDVVQLQEFEPAVPSRQPAFFLLLPATVFIAVKRRRERPALLVASVIFAALGLRAVRLVFDAQLVWAPSLAWGLSRLNPPPRALLGIAAALLSAISLQLRPPALSPAWDDHFLPVRAARFLEEEAVAGPGFNALRDGGYLIMARPQVPTFIDGRLQAFPDRLWLELQEAEKSSATFQAYLRGIGCEWAIATRVRQRLGGYRLLYGPEWALIYWDDASEVFVRRDASRFARLREELEYRYFRPYGRIVGNLSRAELPQLLRELDRYERSTPRDALALIARCAALRRLGADARAACNLRVPPEFAALHAKALSLQAAP